MVICLWILLMASTYQFIEPWNWSDHSEVVLNKYVLQWKVIIFTASCQNGAFWCSSDRCISSSERCDGVRSCSDGSDEMNCSKFFTVANLCTKQLAVDVFQPQFLQSLQLLVEVEHFDAVVVNVSLPPVTVIGLKTAWMAAMKLDVVSYFNWFIKLGACTLYHRLKNMPQGHKYIIQHSNNFLWE